MKVAFSKINITPKDYLGKPMAGYSRKGTCLGKIDNIHAHGALLNFNEKNDNVLLISVDILKLPLSIVEYIKSNLISKFKSLKLDNIVIHATHTHSSFDLTGEFYYPGGIFAFMKGVMFADNKNDKYIVWMTNRILNMVDELFSNLILCKVAWKKIKFNPDIVLNRRWPLRVTTPDLGILSFVNLDSHQLIGLIINYACHPTTLSYKNYMLSADFPGKVVSRIEELTDSKVKVVYINGPSGDLNPITTSGTNYKNIDEDKTITYDQLGTYEHTQKIGYSIGEEALKLAKTLNDEDYSVLTEFEVFTKPVLIPQEDAKYFSSVWLSNTLKWAIKKYFLFKVAKFDKKSVNFPFFTVEKKKLRTYCRTFIQFVKFKSDRGRNFGILTIPGELFEEIGQTLLRQSPINEENIFIFQNSQDWVGYLFPLKTYIEEGGYEPFMCFSPLCGEIIKTEALNLFKEIKENLFN